MELEREYKSESGYDVGKIHDTGTAYYSGDYVKWLETKVNKLTIPVVRSSAYLMDIGNEATIVMADNIADAMDKADMVNDNYAMVYHKSIPILH
jgi:hypothetical protein